MLYTCKPMTIVRLVNAVVGLNPIPRRVSNTLRVIEHLQVNSIINSLDTVTVLKVIVIAG